MIAPFKNDLRLAHVRAAQSELAAKRVAVDATMQDLCAKEQVHTTKMDKATPRFVLDLADDGSTIVVPTDSEQWDLHSDADKADWQDTSILNSSSIGGSEFGAPSRSTGQHGTSKTKGGAVRMLQLLCACNDDGMADVGDDPFPAEYEVGLADEEVEDKAARGRHADNKQTTHARPHVVLFSATLCTMSIEYFNDGAREDFVVGVATGLGVPRNSVRITGAGARGCSVIVETTVTFDSRVQAAAAFASFLTDPAKPLVDEFKLGPCTVPGVRIEESAPAEAPAEEPVPPSAPAMVHGRPPRVIDVAFHFDDDNRHPEEEIEGRDGGLWDYNGTVSDEDIMDDASGEASAAAAAAGDGLRLKLRRMLGNNVSLKHQPSVEIDVYFDEEHTGVLTPRKESPSPPAPDDASATGCTYDDITKSPPPHLRCVISPLPSLSPVHRCTAASPEAGSGGALREAVTRLFGA